MTGSHSKKVFTKEQIPNMITTFRILGTLLLAAAPTLSPAFFVIYSLCGISDVLDGFIARKTNSMSELGAKLDSVADLLFYSVMVIKMMPLLIKYLPAVSWYMLWGVVLVRILIYVIVGIKCHKFSSLHTYLNKFTGLVTFLIPYMIQSTIFACYSVFGCSIAALATAEEILIHIFKKDSHTNVKSLYECYKG